MIVSRAGKSVLAGLLLGLLSPSLGWSQSEPLRPALAAAADTNSWEAYYEQGVARLRREPTAAAISFYWASRLAPDRAEPLYARWVAYWMAHWDRWRDYMEGERDVLRKPEVARADSLRYRAFLRNPFVHTGLSVLIYDQLPGEWRSDPFTQGLLAYGAADLATAAKRFGQVIARDSVKNVWVRWMRSSTLVAQGQPDSALAEMSALLRQLRREDEKELVEAYQSKEMVLYGIGLLHAERGRVGPAREALGQSLVENLAFAPANRALARLAKARRDLATAIAELAQAVELDGQDPVLRYEYGEALLAGGRPAEAVEQLRLARGGEPWWAEPCFELGRALEAMGSADQAAEAYAAYAARAPRNAVLVGSARAKVAELRPPGSTSHRPER